MALAQALCLGLGGGSLSHPILSKARTSFARVSDRGFHPGRSIPINVVSVRPARLANSALVAPGDAR